MPKTFKLFVFVSAPLFFLISAPSTQAAVTCPSPSSIASVTSGYAPLAVFFDATGSTDSNSSIPFQEDLFTWSFADPSAGTWSFSGQPKNTSYGGVAAHVFETPGTYSPTLTIKNLIGETCSVTVPTITVTDPASTMTTYCFSTTSDFTGCPSGATQVTQSNFNTIMSTYLATNRRLLFHRGQTFTSASEASGAIGPWMLASFGSGAKPIINAGTQLLNLFNSSHIVLQDLDIRGTPSVNGANNFCGTYNLLLRVDVQGFDSNSVCDANGWQPSGWPGFHHYTWVDGVWTNYGSMNAFLGGAQVALMGMDFGLFIGPHTSGGHNIRPHVLQKSLMQHNMFRPQNYSGFKHQLKFHSGEFGVTSGYADNKASEFNILSYNTFYSGPSNVAIWNVSIEPQNPNSDNRHNSLVFENNYVTASTGSYGTSGLMNPVRFSGSNSTFRNNIVDAGTSSTPSFCFQTERRGVEPLPGNNRFYNNTCTYRGTNTGFRSFGGTSTGNSVYRNNLFYATSPSPLFGGQDIIDHNLTVTSANPFVNSNYATPTDYKIQTPNASIVGAGVAVPVLNDFVGLLRSSVWDLGAWAVSTGGTPPPTNISPTVSLSVTPTSLTTGGSATLSATASDSDGTISNVQFYVNSNFQATDSTYPYSLSYSPTSAGSYAITAIATDNSGATGSSASVTVTVTTPNNCGNGTIDTGEQCDGTNLNAKTCSTQGFTGGILSCSSCQLVTTSCTSGGGTPNILWTDNIQAGSFPWGFGGISTQHPIGPEVTPSDANGVNFSRVANPLSGGGYAIRQYATFDQGGSRSQAGIGSISNTIFNNQVKSAEGIYMAQEWYFPTVLTTGGDGIPWMNLWDWHSTGAGGANRWHTCPGLMLYEDGSMRVRWEWGCLNTTNPYSSLSTIPLPVGRWFDIEMYYKWSTSSVTLYLWIDGVLALQESGVQTKDPSHLDVETYMLKFYGSQNGGAPWVPTPSIKYGRNVRFSNRRIWQGSSSGNNSPTVSLSVTPTSITTGGSATLSATASDSDGTISNVQFYVNNNFQATDSTYPYSLSYSPTSAGSYAITAIATDNGGATGSSNSVTVTVTAPNNCGNGTIDSGEQCDGTNLNNQTCSTQGFTGGTLFCSSCQLVTTSCTTTGGSTLTLGNNVIGSSTDGNDSNYINTTRFTTGTQGGTTQSISVYIASPIGTSPNNQYSLALYSNSGSLPGTLIANTQNGTLTGNAWNTLPITATLSANTTYWLAYNTNGTAGNQNNFNYSNGSTAGQFVYRTQTFGTWPSSFGVTSANSAIIPSIYLTYSPPPLANALSNLSFSFTTDTNLSLSGKAITTSILPQGSTKTTLALETQTPTASYQGSTNQITLPTTGRTPGSYDVQIKAPGTLSRKQTFTLASNQTFTLTNKLISGDINNDNAINALDWSMMSPDWFQTGRLSDINGDGITNALDFTWLNRNWFLVGE